MPNPSRPWLRLWDCTLDLPKAQRLTGDQFKGWVNLLMLANRQDVPGTLPEMVEIAFSLRLPEARIAVLIEALVNAKLIDRNGSDLVMHDWARWQPIEKTNAERSREWREQQKQQALNGSARRALSPSAPEKSRERVEGEKRALERSRSNSTPSEIASLGTEYQRVGELAMNMSGDLSWGAWVQQQALAGHSAAYIEAAIKEASGVGKLSKPYVSKILQRWAVEGRPKELGHGKSNGPPKPEPKPLTTEQDEVIKKRQRESWPSRERNTK